MRRKQWFLKTSVCPLYLIASEAGLEGIFWTQQDVPMARSLNGSELEMQILAQAVCELEEYFRGQRKEFTVPLAVKGTEFQLRVWEELRKIPFGKTYSYSAIARRLKNEKAVRAVGTANGRNPIPIIVPCHRVIAADGTLGGYAGGLELKEKLLGLEKAWPVA